MTSSIPSKSVRVLKTRAAAIERFLRPVCYQDFLDALLPAALRKEGAKWPHRYDGVYRTE